MVVVTHDPEVAKTAERTIEIRDGRVHDLGEKGRRAVSASDPTTTPATSRTTGPITTVPAPPGAGANGPRAPRRGGAGVPAGSCSRARAGSSCCS